MTKWQGRAQDMYESCNAVLQHHVLLHLLRIERSILGWISTSGTTH